MIVLYSKMQKKDTGFPVDRYFGPDEIGRTSVNDYQAGDQRTQDILNFYQVRMNSVGGQNTRLDKEVARLNGLVRKVQRAVKPWHFILAWKIRKIIKQSSEPAKKEGE